MGMKEDGRKWWELWVFVPRNMGWTILGACENSLASMSKILGDPYSGSLALAVCSAALPG